MQQNWALWKLTLSAAAKLLHIRAFCSSDTSSASTTTSNNWKKTSHQLHICLETARLSEASYWAKQYLNKHLRDWIAFCNYIIDLLVCQIKVPTFACCIKCIYKLLWNDLINQKTDTKLKTSYMIANCPCLLLQVKILSSLSTNVPLAPNELSYILLQRTAFWLYKPIFYAINIPYKEKLLMYINI